MSVLDDLLVYLAAAPGGTFTFTPVAGTTVFGGRRTPDDPDVLVSMIQYPGRKPVMTHTSANQIAWEYPRVQVVARSVNGSGGYTEADGNAYAAYKYLNGITNTTINGTFYMFVRALQTPFEMGPDEKDRPVYGFNLECQKYVS